MNNTRWTLVILALLLLVAAWPSVSRAAFAGKDFIHWDGIAGTAGSTTDDTTAVAMEDSTVIMGTAAYQHGYLYLKPNRPCRLAITIKALGDSFSTSGAISRADSTKATTWTWGLVDSLAGARVFKPMASQPTAGAAGSGQIIVDFPANAAAKFATPRGIQIPLRSPFTGEWYWGHHTQIKYHVLSAGGTVTMTGWSHWVSF